MSQYAEFRLAKKPLHSPWRVAGDVAHRTIPSRTIPPYHRRGYSTFKFSGCIHKLKYKASTVANRNLKVYKLSFATPLNTSKIQREKNPTTILWPCFVSSSYCLFKQYWQHMQGWFPTWCLFINFTFKPFTDLFFAVLTAQISSIKSLRELLSHSTQL